MTRKKKIIEILRPHLWNHWKNAQMKSKNGTNEKIATFIKDKLV